MRNLLQHRNLITLIIASTFVVTVVFLTGTNQVFAQEAKFAIQATQKSMQDPLPGHEGHQIVIALPPRDDGKFYTGTVTYVASQPVEVVVLHPFNATATDQSHGEPLNAPFKNGKVAISLMKEFTGATNAGSLNFAGSALALHNIEGKPFSVTYSTTGWVTSPVPLP
jgi:hypothetical protein